jgi:hypothetical protein
VRNVVVNTKQKTVLKAVSAAIFLILLFPPFRWVNRGTIESAGFNIAFHPPKISYGPNASIDIGMLQMEFLAILVVGFIFLIINTEQK